MNKLIEKIVERLQDLRDSNSNSAKGSWNRFDSRMFSYISHAYQTAIDIIHEEAKAYNETLDILLDFLVSLGIENVCEELGDNLWGMDNTDETWCSRNCGVINDGTCPSKECYLEYVKMMKAEREG